MTKGRIVLVYSDFDDQTKMRKIALSVKPTVIKNNNNKNPPPFPLKNVPQTLSVMS